MRAAPAAGLGSGCCALPDHIGSGEVRWGPDEARRGLAGLADTLAAICRLGHARAETFGTR